MEKISLNVTAIYLSLGIFPVACLYPLAKRYTYYAQTVLGVCFNSGIFIGAAQIGGVLTAATALKLAPFYIGSIMWTMIYDSIYAYGDKEDDKKQGLKGLAVLWGDKTLENCKRLNIVKTGLFGLSGYLMALNPLFTVGVAALGGYNHYLLNQVDLKDQKKCQDYFDKARYFGFVIAALIYVGKLTI